MNEQHGEITPSPTGGRVFVTGAGGMIGRRVVSFFAERGVRVRALRHVAAVKQPGIEIVQGDLRQFRDEWLDGISVIVHLAAKTHSGVADAELFAVNADSVRTLTASIARAGRPVRLLFASSIAVYGPCLNGRAHTAQTAPVPITPYGRSKLAGEQAAAGCADVRIVRLPMVVGPGDRFSGRFMRLTRWRIFPCTLRRFSAIHVDDVAALFWRLAQDDGTDRTVLAVSDGEAYSWPEIAAHFARLRGRRMLTPRIPEALLRPGIFRWLGNADAALYLKYDWILEPNFPEGMAPRRKAFARGEQ